MESQFPSANLPPATPHLMFHSLIPFTIAESPQHFSGATLWASPPSLALSSEMAA